MMRGRRRRVGLIVGMVGMLAGIALLAAAPASAQLLPLLPSGPSTSRPAEPDPAADSPESGPVPATADGPAPATARPSRSPSPETPVPPCTRTARACVDLTAHQAWLTKDGRATYGPVEIASGGEDKETPVGTFHVQWKHKDHYSSEYPDPNGDPRGAPMPYSAFFADGGVAFHGARNLHTPSAGCVKLHFDGFDRPSDAQKFFDTLQVGDEVQVVSPA